MALEASDKTGEPDKSLEPDTTLYNSESIHDDCDVVYMSSSSSPVEKYSLNSSEEIYISLENPSLTGIEAELEDSKHDRLVMLPGLTSSVLENHIGQYDIGLYDQDILNEPPELEESTRNYVHEFADLLDQTGLKGVISVDVYERGKDPQYLRYSGEQVSDQVMEELCGAAEILDSEEDFEDGRYLIKLG